MSLTVGLMGFSRFEFDHRSTATALNGNGITSYNFNRVVVHTFSCSMCDGIVLVNWNRIVENESQIEEI